MSDTIFLRFIAILLITNSHLDGLYPVTGLASGGALGNSLFFMMSGLGLALSRSMHSRPGFLNWLRYRLARVYPPIWLVVLLVPVLMLSFWKQWNGWDLLYHFVYPTPYWFISALVVFYILVYPILRFGWQKWVSRLILLLIIPYFYFYATVMDLSKFTVENGSLFKWIFYFQIMLFGIWLAPRYREWKADGFHPGWRSFLALAVTCACYTVLKLIIAKGFFTEWQFAVQWLTFPFVYFALRCVFHPWFEAFLEQTGVVSLIINIMASTTLEIYLLQHHLYNLPWVVQLMFPLNTLVFWLMIIPFAYLVHKAAKPIERLLRQGT